MKLAMGKRLVIEDVCDGRRIHSGQKAAPVKGQQPRPTIRTASRRMQARFEVEESLELG